MVQVKICGVNSPGAMTAAVENGADFIGLVFYPPSPRAVTPEKARDLAALAGMRVKKVGLFVDPGDGLLDRTLAAVKLDMLQLHGKETTARVAEIKKRTGLAAMKAIKVASAADLIAADDFAAAADWLLFDGVPPSDKKNALPGGNAAQFDWALLAGRKFTKPWMLSGGLTPGNVAQAIRISGAPCVDVSSGVETHPGLKDLAKIAAFIRAARGKT